MIWKKIYIWPCVLIYSFRQKESWEFHWKLEESSWVTGWFGMEWPNFEKMCVAYFIANAEYSFNYGHFYNVWEKQIRGKKIKAFIENMILPALQHKIFWSFFLIFRLNHVEKNIKIIWYQIVFHFPINESHFHYKWLVFQGNSCSFSSTFMSRNLFSDSN